MTLTLPDFAAIGTAAPADDMNLVVEAVTTVDANLSAALDAIEHLQELSFNVVELGVVADGVTDSTADLQAIIDDAPPGSYITFPHTADPILFDRLTVSGGVRMIGAGFRTYANDPFGDANYFDPTYITKGSVLRSTATSGTAISFADSPELGGYGIENICVLGPGSGTSTGIKMGVSSNPTNAAVNNVEVQNFSRCWYLHGVEDSTFVNMRARACHTGIETDNAFNQNVLINTQVQFSDTYGIKAADGTANQWLGGLLQNTSGTAALHHVSGEVNVYQGFYYESSSPPTDVVSVAAGSMNTWREWWANSASQRISINGGGRNKFSKFRSASMSVVVNAGSGHVLEDMDGMTLTGAAAADSRVLDGTSGLVLPTGGVHITAGGATIGGNLAVTAGACTVSGNIVTSAGNISATVGDLLVAAGQKLWMRGAASGVANLYSSGANTVKTDAGLYALLGLELPTGTGLTQGSWLDYVTGSNRYVRDLTNSKMHITMAPGAGLLGLTLFNSAVEIAGNVGFYGVANVARASAYTQNYATADKTHSNPTAAALTVTDGAGTNDGTIGAITADASVIAAVQELAAQIGKLVADVADTKQLVNSVIDDLQAYGLFQ